MTNFRWLRNVFPPLLEVIREDRYIAFSKKFDKLLARVEKKDCRVVTASGHSLGGGLAQLAGRLSKGQIKRVVVFNTSDVIGDEIEGAREVNDLSIERVYERGEALAYVRRVLELTNHRVGGLSCKPLIVDVRFSFDESIWASKRHSMNSLAYGLLIAAHGVDAGPDSGDLRQTLGIPEQCGPPS